MSSASFFARRDGPRDKAAVTPIAATDVSEQPHRYELDAYLELPQIANTSEWAGLKWWEENAAKFPNLSVMAARGWAATRAAVARAAVPVAMPAMPMVAARAGGGEGGRRRGWAAARASGRESGRPRER